MTKRGWDNYAATVSTPVAKHSKQYTWERSAPSGCQACALHIPTFFCEINCNGEGGLIVDDKALPPLPHDQQLQGRVSDRQGVTHHQVKRESYTPTINTCNITYFTDTDTDTDNDADINTPTDSSEPSLTDNHTSPAGNLLLLYGSGFDYLQYSLYNPPVQSEQDGSVESLETGSPTLFYQDPNQLQYPTQSSNQTRGYQPYNGFNRSQHSDPWPEQAADPDAQAHIGLSEWSREKERNGQEIHIGPILQELAKMEAQFTSNTQEQLRVMGYNRRG